MVPRDRILIPSGDRMRQRHNTRIFISNFWKLENIVIKSSWFYFWFRLVLFGRFWLQWLLYLRFGELLDYLNDRTKQHTHVSEVLLLQYSCFCKFLTMITISCSYVVLFLIKYRMLIWNEMLSCPFTRKLIWSEIFFWVELYPDTNFTNFKLHLKFG